MLISTSFLSSMNPASDLKLLNETDTDYIHVEFDLITNLRKGC